ncbi:MAG: NADH-quinone oxidoreductase subunit C [Elusimicrobiota bacterium]|nr:NADH-quinone oxidoreductase subunit C [Elusimicrobiota bacterium]
MKETLDIIKKNLGKKILDIKIHNEKRVYIEISSGDIRPAAEFMFNRLKCRFAIATGTDERDYLEILYHFLFDRKGIFFTLRTKLDPEAPEIDTLTDIITGTKWIERELHELMGISFTGNDDLRNLLLSADYKGRDYPLRKE